MSAHWAANSADPIARAARGIILAKYDGAPPWNTPIPDAEWDAAVEQARRPPSNVIPLRRPAAPDPQADFTVAYRAMMAAFWRLADADQSAARWAAGEAVAGMLGVLDVGDGA